MIRRLSQLALSLCLTAVACLPMQAVAVVDQELIDVLPQRPDLMHLDYLEHLIGRPGNERSQRYQANKTYYWYNQRHQVMYELHQVENYPGSVVASTFVMHVPDFGIKFDQLADQYEKYSVKPQRLFDNQANLSEVYSLVPNTALIFTAPQDAMRIERVKVMYSGPPLPRPSQDELHDVELIHIGRLATPAPDGRWDIPIPPLAQHLKRHPYDAEGRFWMGQAQREHGHIDDAICQYKAAYALAGDDDELKARCVAGLTQLKALPTPPEVIADQHVYKIHKRGQRLRHVGPVDEEDTLKDNEESTQLAEDAQARRQQTAGLATPPLY